MGTLLRLVMVVCVGLVLGHGAMGGVAAEPGVPPIPNGDFARGDAGGIPGRWIVPTAGLTARLGKDDESGGGSGVELKLDGGKGGPFGTFMQGIDAMPYRGKSVLLHFVLRAGGKEGRAQPWMRVDRRGDVVGWFDNQPALRPDLLMWLPNLTFQALGLWMFYKVDRS